MKNQLQTIIDTKTKPLGALGFLETIALQIGCIQNSISPQINNPHIVVFAADHGIAATGLVNPFPQSVTAQMVLNFANNGAAINVFAKLNEIELLVVDAGVNFDFDANLNIVHNKINKGTKNYLTTDAMTIEEVNEAIEKGKEIVDEIAKKNCNTIGFGEMGIGNTSSASLLMNAILQNDLPSCIGKGTGANELQLATKINTLLQVAQQHNILALQNNPIELLCKVGGFEIAMMVGAYLAAHKNNIAIVVDGFIASAALLVACSITKNVISNCIFAHCSNEQGHILILQYLQATPLLNLELRLGEGTGTALAMPLLRAACAFVNEMASFESAGVSNKTE
jgi:nicotinate-nucleotide--dimethylbenzimidazole phosphoribosyltransferase